MATAKKATSAKRTKKASKKVDSKKEHGTWSVGNLPSVPGTILYTDKMKQQLIDAVAEADKNGTPRIAVFNALAKKWSKARKHDYTSHQVSSKFHQCKGSFGYDVVRQTQPRKIAAKKANDKAKQVAAQKVAAKKTGSAPRPEVVLSQLTVDLPKAIAALQTELDAARAEAKANAAKATAAEKALARISKVLGPQTAA